MAIARTDATDVLAINNSEEMIGVIESVIKNFPTIQALQSVPVEKTVYNTLVTTANPTAAFRAVNAGREVQKPTLASRTVTCKFLDASWNIDKAAVDACEWGKDAALALQAAAGMRGAFAAIESQIFYGTGADANGFAGISSLLDDSDDSMVVNAGGSTADIASSVYAIKTGVQDVALAWGMGGKLSESEIDYTQIFDGDGKSFWGYAQDVSGYIGLQLTNYNALGRICNLTTDSGKGLTDDLISDMLSEFPSNELPDMLVMSRRSLKQLQQARTATNISGAPAPFPSEAFGVPIITTDSVVNTEALLTAAT
jgi:hypothetical protein